MLRQKYPTQITQPVEEFQPAADDYRQSVRAFPKFDCPNVLVALDRYRTFLVGEGG